MRFIADFHIHSHFSLATSKQLTPEHLDYWAKLKGIQVIGMGDCIHPGWLREIKSKVTSADNGLYQLKKKYRITDVVTAAGVDHEPFFMLTAEISSIYKKNGKVRKNHNVCVFPHFEAAMKVQKKLDAIGNIRSDGRPILGLDAKHLLEIVLESDDESFLIPAHIWTPWFSLLGSKSGFDHPEECFEELAPYIFAMETGLSSDPIMNRMCSFLDDYRLVSNSDAHSPNKLGREANLFDTNLSYAGMLNALKRNEGFLGTIEFFPQEGKYYFDGHRNCNVAWSPEETEAHDGLCCVCGKGVTKGVRNRVWELADRTYDEAAALFTHTMHPKKREQAFVSITPLVEIIREIQGMKSSTGKAVQKTYFELIEKLGPEFDILLTKDLSEIKNKGGEALAKAIKNLRANKVHIKEGYDGEFGTISCLK